MSLDVNSDPTAPASDTPVVKAQAKPALVNEQKLPEELIRTLKSTKHEGGKIDDYKGATFKTKRGNDVVFHIKPKPQKNRSYIIGVTGNEGSSRDKGKHNRGSSFKEIEVANYTINWQEDAELLTILEKKMGQSDDNKAKLHGKKKK